MRTGPYPNIVQQADAALNDSDKTFVVPTGKHGASTASSRA